jgi:hypothetical protein
VKRFNCEALAYPTYDDRLLFSQPLLLRLIPASLDVEGHACWTSAVTQRSNFDHAHPLELAHIVPVSMFCRRIQAWMTEEVDHCGRSACAGTLYGGRVPVTTHVRYGAAGRSPT